MTPLLRKLGLLSKIDRAALAAYCQSYARWAKAEKQIAKTSEVVKSPNNFPILNPWLSVSKAALKDLSNYIREFGLSPSARTRVEVQPPDEEEDPFVQFARRYNHE